MVNSKATENQTLANQGSIQIFTGLENVDLEKSVKIAIQIWIRKILSLAGI